MLRQIGLAVAGPLALAGWSVAPAFASSGPYTNGELVRFQGQSAVYVVRNQSLHWIASSALFSALGYQWSRVHVLPMGIPRPRTGAAVRYLQLPGHSHLYYWSPYNRLYHFPDPFPQYRQPSSTPPANDIFQVSQLPSAITPWPNNYSDSIMPSLPNGLIVGLPHQSPLYVYQSGHLHWIASAAIFRAAGYSFNNVYLGGDPHLPNTAPWGDTLPSSPGAPKTLLRVIGTAKIYSLINGTLHWIPSWADFTSWGFSPNAIQPVHYLPYPIGTALTTLPQ